MTVATSNIRNAGPEELKWHGPAMAQLRILKQQMGITGLKIGRRKVTLAEGVTCLCNICFKLEEVFVRVASVAGEAVEVLVITIGGIILHPRSGTIGAFHYYTYAQDVLGMTETTTHTAYGVGGGWANGITPLTAQYLFPLLDNDNASFVDGYEITATADGVITGQVAKSMFSASGMYGNLYWTNDAAWNGTAWDKPFMSLSWRGTPTRHGRVPSNCNIPGISTIEAVHAGVWDDVNDYTTFGSYLYKGGSVFATAPRYSWPDGAPIDRCLILGAMRNSAGVTFIVTQNDHYNAPGFVWTLSNGETVFGNETTDGSDRVTELNSAIPRPDPLVRIMATAELTKPGFFIGVWSNKYNYIANIKRDGWELLLEIPHGRVGLPWFGNFSGTAFVCSNGDAVTLNGFVATYTAHTDVTGNYSETLPTLNRYEFKAESNIINLLRFYEYNQDVKTNGVVNLTFSAYSVQSSGEWAAIYEVFGANGTGEHTRTIYTDDSSSVVAYTPVCLLSSSEPMAFEFTEVATNTPCDKYSWDGTFMGVGRSTAAWHSKAITEWEGSWPGSEHFINTDYRINVCGVVIPIVVTTRHWKDSRGPHNTIAAVQANKKPLTITEHCSITTSTIHFIDQRYGVCLYKTRTDTIVFDYTGRGVATLNQYGSQVPYSQCAVTEEMYTASTTEVWHIVVGGIDTTVATTTLPLLPFGEPIGSGVDVGIIRLLVFPVPGASVAPPVGSEEPIARLGCYEDGYDDPFGGQSMLDGGRDHYYPEWCRGLQEDPFWKAAAGSRYTFTAPQSTAPLYSSDAYTPPEVIVEPIPLGSFARHPMLGDLYQFLISKFDGNNHIVVSSASINAKIDESLAAGLATHDTTLYSPISIV